MLASRVPNAGRCTGWSGLGPIFCLLLFVRGWRQVLLTRLPVPLPRVARKDGNEMGMTPLLWMSGEDSGHRSDGKPTR